MVQGLGAALAAAGRMRDITKGERGTTLVEAIIAASLLVTIVAGTAALIVLARRLGEQTEIAIAATFVAGAKLQALRAVPFGYDIGGGVPEVPALAYAPSEALERNTTGLWDVLDATGRTTSDSAAGPAALVRRWATWPVSGATGDCRSIEVCVFAWPANADAPPLVCLASVRTRQP